MSWPFHAGLKEVGMGAGPTHLLARGDIVACLQAQGWGVDVETVATVDERMPEIARVFELDRRLAERVRRTIEESRFPLVLAGNCSSCLGTVAGMGATDAGVVWFDAHADFDTTEDNLSGFTDVMGLAILTGTGWRALRETIPGFAPVAEENVVLAGVRDLLPYQRARLEPSRVLTCPPSPRSDGGWSSAFAAALDDLKSRVPLVYLHIDLDVLDPSEGSANEYAAPDGLALDELVGAIDAVCSRFEVGASAITAYDPALDPQGQMAAGAARVAEAVAAGVRGAGYKPAASLLE